MSASVTKRATPDISMFASTGGFWGHELVVCDTGGGQPCAANSFGFAGGTSFAAPAFAGILGLLKTSTGSRQGLVQPALYALVKAQYTAGTACYANGQTANTGITKSLPASSCIFNDVTTSGNDNECQAGTPNCFTNPGAGFGVLTSSGNTSTFVDAYAAGAKYDIATGLGSINVTNMINKWSTAFSSSTKLAANPTTIASTASTQLTATVTGGQPAGYGSKAPALNGSVTFTAGGKTVGTCTLSGGSCSSTVNGSALQTGDNSILATFSGSGTYPSSTSSVVTVTVTAAATKQTLVLTMSSAAIESGQTLGYTATVKVGSGPAATGTVTFSDKQTGTIGTVQLSNGSYSSSTQQFTTVGTYTFNAHYSGDSNYPALDAQPVVVVVRAFPLTLQLVGTGNPQSGTVKAGASFSYKVMIGDGKGPALNGQVVFFASINGGAMQSLGGYTITGSQLMNGDLFTSTYSLSKGTYVVYAGYTNDANYASIEAQVPITINVQ